MGADYETYMLDNFPSLRLLLHDLEDGVNPLFRMVSEFELQMNHQNHLANNPDGTSAEPKNPQGATYILGKTPILKVKEN